MHITGDPEGPPTKVGYAVTDVLTSHHITQGILTALLHRDRTKSHNFKGEGQLVETNLLHSSLYSLNYVVGSYLNGGIDY
jgi:crotonobetainyl-CoA:carnitine CoA-transferase CaiB-like acyl-CoA transferase